MLLLALTAVRNITRETLGGRNLRGNLMTGIPMEEPVFPIEPQIVTLLGARLLTCAWVLPCMSSWKRIRGSIPHIEALSDGTLTREACNELNGISIRCDPAEQEHLVKDALQKYPALRRIRENDFSWRKILDASIIMLQRGGMSLLIDTDVYVRSPVHVCLRHDSKSLVYLREDIPAYRGSWNVVFREPMVVSFNSGMVLFNAAVIDLNFLEYAVSRYISKLKDYWWSEQLAWSLVAGRIESRFYWDGRSARVVSGFGMRSPKEISRNVVKSFSRKQFVRSSLEMSYYCGDAPVIHMGGMGKQWFEALLPGHDNSRSIPLETCHDSLLTTIGKIKIASRLFAKEWF